MRLRLLFLVALLVAPLAAADHVFSHRVYLVGRVIDSDGLPAPGIPVNVTFSGIPGNARCYDSKPEVTDATGDYVVCKHAHAIPADASATVTVAGQSRELALDPDLRHARANFQLGEPRALRDINGERTFARTFLVTGRAFALLADPETAEGVPVNATPLTANVTAELRHGDEVLARGEARPDEHGTFRVLLDVADVPDGAVVRVRAGSAGAEELGSALFRRADANVISDLRLAAGPGRDAPGSETPLPWWMALGAAGCAAALGAGRRKK